MVVTVMKPSASVKKLVPAEVLNRLKDDEWAWLENTFSRFGGHYPSLEQMWEPMDESWSALGGESTCAGFASIRIGY